MKTRLTPFAKLLIVVILAAAAGLVLHQTGMLDKIIPNGNENSTTTSNKKSGNLFGSKDVPTYKIGVVTWGGYAGGQYFNKGFEANEESRFYKDYGFKVEFKVLDDFNISRNAWKAGEVDLLWATVDAFTTEMPGLKDYEPQIIMQADWSRGGDAVVVRRGISKVQDLKGKKVAFAEMTPSHTFLLWMLEAGNLKFEDIDPVKVASAIDAADLFKKGQVDAAVVWSPDDADCVAKVVGSKVLQSTKEASHIIADVFVVKKAFLEEHKENLTNLVRGWMIGASEINQSEDAKREASQILAQGLQLPEDFTYDAINNVRLCTYGDNVNFFGLNTDYKGVTGEDLYNKMDVKYSEAGYIESRIPSWRLVGNSSLITAITDLTGAEHQPEGAKEFSAVTEEVKTSEEISTKTASISFRSGEFELDENAKYIVDNEFTDLAKMFGSARIRIEGNTDNVGNRAMNIELSKKRAQSVVDYMVTQHGFDRNRFVVVGNGPDKPVADNNSDDGRRKNRRTEFKMLK